MEGGATTLATVAFTFIDVGVAHGLSRERLYALAGLDDATRSDPDARISDLVLVKLWMELIGGLRDVVIPLAIVRGGKLPLGILAHIVRHATTVREALDLAGRYRRLGDDDVRVEHRMREDGALGLVTRHRPEVDAMGLPLEVMVGWSFKLLSEALGRPLPLREVTFAHAARYPLAPYEAFFGGPVRFSAGANAVWLDPATLDLPLAKPDADLRVWLQAQADRMLAALPPDEDPLHARLRAAIAGELSDGAELPRVAKKLALSARTLQRRLAEHGTSFQDVVDKVRADSAKQLLRDRERSILDAAFELGYADLASFYRAFKRWTGRTPAEWRAEAR